MNRSGATRREFLANTIRIGALAGLGAHVRFAHAAPASSLISAGEGVVDTTPPLGIELAGFHRSPGNERLITGIRQPTAVRALVLKHGDVQLALVSLDAICVHADLVARVRARVEKATGIPGKHLRLCSTHSHSTPTFMPLLQWGAIPEKYMAEVEDKIVEAVKLAQEDLGESQAAFGKSRAIGGNFNRTTSSWKTDEQFNADSTDDDRWLDTMLHVLHFDRGEGKRDLLWYQFSAHPVCYTDGNAGPDWCGLVQNLVQEKTKLSPSFLQGHAGDVNPGNGDPWLGEPGQVSSAIATAVEQALVQAKPLEIDAIAVTNSEVAIPLNVELMRDQLERYRANPAEFNSGEWVDAPFAAAWAENAAKWDSNQTSLATPISAMRLGPVGLFFHPSELYSYYGLQIRRDSPFEDTICVGYTDGLIGYLTDPKAYVAGEYAALVVPKICYLPPFTPNAAREFTAAGTEALKQLQQA
jgi:hypothetical protein